MAYIQPNSTIRFHKDIPLDNTYDHTLYFDTLSEQTTYFSDTSLASGKILLSLDNYSYQRHTKNSIRVAVQMETIVNCSYMSFKNTSFENKWFYAFITDMEYINNSTTEVFYEIDVMQTYFFDYELEQCFVERQHTISDNIGDNTVPESLELGEYVYTDFGMLESTASSTGSYKLVIAATFTGVYSQIDDEYTFTDSGGDTYGGLYSGVYPNVFSYETVGGWYLANKFLIDATAQNKSSGIVGIFMLPLDFFSYNVGTGEYTLNANAKQSVFPLIKGTNWTYDNHYCKNNKLYTFPYSLLTVDNGQGSSANYRWEFFSTTNAVLRVYYTGNSSPELVCAPDNYNGLTTNYKERIIINNIPQCAYAIDSYLAWLAQNNTKLNISMLSSVVGGIANVAGGLINGRIQSAVSSGVSAITTIGQILAERHVASTMPAHAEGTEANVANMSTHNFGFRAYSAHIRPEYAKIIDEYFTRFGYAINRNTVPNQCARTRFTYIKTIDCTIIANLPANYMKQIVNNYNNGITFWKDHAHVGDYSYEDNSVISG